MIKLTKLNDETVVVNINQIKMIEIIPESKLIFAGEDYLIVKESAEEIIEKVIDFSAKVYNLHKHIVVEQDAGDGTKQFNVE